MRPADLLTRSLVLIVLVAWLTVLLLVATWSLYWVGLD